MVEMLRCLFCGCRIKKPKKKFCCNAHKDKYHNEHNPRGYYEHLNPDSPNYVGGFDEAHPLSMEGTNWGGTKD